MDVVADAVVHMRFPAMAKYAVDATVKISLPVTFEAPSLLRLHLVEESQWFALLQMWMRRRDTLLGSEFVLLPDYNHLYCYL